MVLALVCSAEMVFAAAVVAAELVVMAELVRLPPAAVAVVLQAAAHSAGCQNYCLYS